MAKEQRKLSPQAVHLVRTATQTNLMLSQMADQKASILMGATFVIFTITIGRAQGATAPLPLLILGGAAFLSAICAILAVLPKTKAGRGGAKPNILFFGVFTAMDEDAFVDDLLLRLKTDDSLYRTMARDIYQGGMVLQNKKYRMLGWAYRILLLGLVASCASYVAIYLI